MNIKTSTALASWRVVSADERSTFERLRLAAPPVDTALFASAAYRAVADQKGRALAYLVSSSGLAQIHNNFRTDKCGATCASTIEARRS